MYTLFQVWCNSCFMRSLVLGVSVHVSTIALRVGPEHVSNKSTLSKQICFSRHISNKINNKTKLLYGDIVLQVRRSTDNGSAWKTGDDLNMNMTVAVGVSLRVNTAQSFSIITLMSVRRMLTCKWKLCILYEAFFSGLLYLHLHRRGRCTGFEFWFRECAQRVRR